MRIFSLQNLGIFACIVISSAIVIAGLSMLSGYQSSVKAMTPGNYSNNTRNLNQTSFNVGTNVTINRTMPNDHEEITHANISMTNFSNKSNVNMNKTTNRSRHLSTVKTMAPENFSSTDEKLSLSLLNDNATVITIYGKTFSGLYSMTYSNNSGTDIFCTFNVSKNGTNSRNPSQVFVFHENGDLLTSLGPILKGMVLQRLA